MEKGIMLFFAVHIPQVYESWLNGEFVVIEIWLRSEPNVLLIERFFPVNILFISIRRWGSKWDFHAKTIWLNG